MAKPRGGRDNSHRSAYQANLDRKHETRMAIIHAMAADPELKYYIGVAMGSAGAAIGTWMIEQGFMEGVSSGTADADAAGAAVANAQPKGPFGWLVKEYTMVDEIAGGMVSTTAKIQSGIEGISGPFGSIGAILTIGGTGFAGFCAAVLMLKAIFGDEDVATLMSAAAAAADAVIPL